MTERAALLIGVPSYRSDLFEAFPHVVEADIGRMADVLAKSDYTVTRCGVGGPENGNGTRNDIGGAMKKAIRAAPPGGILLIYYSGHGVVLDGESYLVPSDAYSDRDELDADSLLPLMPPSLGACPARLVLFFVDACRNDVSRSLTLPEPGKLPCPPDGAFVIVNSCSPGEWSSFSEDGSYFTQALAEVLDRRSPAQTVDDVVQAVVQRMTQRSALSDHIQQTPRASSSQADMTGAPAGSIAICYGDRVSDLWRSAVESCPLWSRTSADARTIAETRAAVHRAVDECSRRWSEARDHLRDRAGLADSWSTPEHAVRTLARLVDLLPGDCRLTTAELASAIAAPFVREVAVSAGLVEAAGIQPQNFGIRYGAGARARHDLEITHEMHEHVWRRAEGLDRRGRVEARDLLAMWLVHRWLAGRRSLIDGPDVTELIEQISVGTVDVSGPTAREIAANFRVMVRCADAGQDDEGMLAELMHAVLDLRFRTLGALLWLSSILAIDARRMPSLIVDHLGVTHELSLPALHNGISAVKWIRRDGVLALHATCNHPALFTLLEGVAERAGKTRRALAKAELDPHLASWLPTEINDAELRPEAAGGVPAFATPVLRFRLSDEKVRELLMGRQLYGEPALAIRELYQNALDACRYRWTRREYKRRNNEGLTEWAGKISIRQGEEGGRQYIECRDNGVGMTKTVLEKIFANAGERFIYQSAFRAEYAKWQELKEPLDFVPNSQFGVGVFSYFMIAEEIEIRTWPTTEQDAPQVHGYCVRIVSSGSLFQITDSWDPPGGGTVVRLYLTGEDSVSVLKTMRQLLWTAEFKVEVAEDGTPAERWQPGELRYTGSSVTPLRHGEDFWWVSGEGGLAADGIRTNEERYGLVVNLRGERRPRFTVDRNSLREWDREWINQQILDSLPALAQWRGLTFNWLWNVTEKAPVIGEMIFAWLVNHEQALPVEGPAAHGSPPVAAQIGCLPLDRLLFSGELNGWNGGFSWLTAWRAAVWQGHTKFPFMDRIPIPGSVRGYPVAEPLDAAVVMNLYDRGGRSSSLGRPAAERLLEILADEEESPRARLRRLRRLAVAGLDLRAARAIPPVTQVLHESWATTADGTEDRQLLFATPAWNGPGTVALRNAASWLALVSQRMRLPLREVVSRASKIVPADWSLSNEQAVAALGQKVFESAEIELIRRPVDDDDDYWIEPDIRPFQVLGMSLRHGRPVADVLSALDALAPLGYLVLDRELIPLEMSPIERDAMMLVDDRSNRVNVFDLLIMAGLHDRDLQGVHDGLDRLQTAGLVSLPALSPDAAGIVPTEIELGVIRENLYRYDRRTGGQRVKEGWSAVSFLAAYVHSTEGQADPGRLASCRRLLDLADVRRPITLPEFLDLAAGAGTLRAAVHFYRTIFPETADTSALPPSVLVSDLRVQWPFVGGLLNWTAYMYADAPELTWDDRPAGIVGVGARLQLTVPEVLDTLEPYRGIGAPVPSITDSDRAWLAGHTLDLFDVGMLPRVDPFGIAEPISTVTPLYLIQLAGRFGWSPAEARARFGRFELLGLDVPIRPELCDDEIVAWQDLLVLTTFLDGQEPALAGPVPHAHLRAAAEEIGESVARVRGRLERFAELFGLSVDQTSDADEEISKNG